MRRLFALLTVVLVVIGCTRVVTAPSPTPAPVTLEAGCDTTTQWIRRFWRQGQIDTVYAELHVCPRIAPPAARPRPAARSAA